jgi:hypothetical protein
MTPPHSEWISTSSYQLTGETFGLIDPVSVGSSNIETEDDTDALVEGKVDEVMNTLLELETGLGDKEVLLNDLPESSCWLAVTFGRWRPSARVRGDVEWEYFSNNIGHFQCGAGGSGEADNYSGIRWSAFADHWNKMVASLGASNPNFTYKTASLLQDAHQRLQKRARRDNTIFPHIAGINSLREMHTAVSSNQRFANQFVAAKPPTRARPNRLMQESCAQFDWTGDIAYNDGGEMGSDLESPAEQVRRLRKGKRPRKNAAP